MGIIKGFRQSTIPVIIALAVLLPANILSWVAFSTTSWAYVNNTAVNFQGYGLWRICATSGSCSLLDGTRSEWYAAFQACGVFGFMGINVAMLLVIMYMFVEWWKEDVELKVGAIASCFFGAASYIAAVVVFSKEIRGWLPNSTDLLLGFSLWLAVAAIVLSAIAGALLLVDLILNILKITMTINSSSKNSTTTTTTSTTITTTSSSNSQGKASKAKANRRIAQEPV